LQGDYGPWKVEEVEGPNWAYHTAWLSWLASGGIHHQPIHPSLTRHCTRKRRPFRRGLAPTDRWVNQSINDMPPPHESTPEIAQPRYTRSHPTPMKHSYRRLAAAAIHAADHGPSPYAWSAVETQSGTSGQLTHADNADTTYS
jgi:hypothetical protein